MPGSRSEPAAAPPASRFDRRLAALLAGCAEAAYLPGEEAVSARLRSPATCLGRGATAVFAAVAGGRTVLAFRGTVPPGPAWHEAAANWLTNLDAAQADTEIGRVHRGFWTALSSVWDGVLGHVRGRPGPVWVTGHSLGGALAVLAAARLAAAGVAVAGTYTFGAPRVGGPDFAARPGPPHHRVEAGNDIVPRTPPDRETVESLRPLLPARLAAAANGVDYRPSGRLAFVNWRGLIEADWTGPAADRLERERIGRLTAAAIFDRDSLLADHRMERYRSALGPVEGDRVRPASG